MPQIEAFHEVLFPTDIALGSTGGPERKTEIITLASGHEKRNARWAHSRRRYNAGYGVKTLDDLHKVIDFFEERRGRLFGFRFRDPMDNSSCTPGQAISPNDQILGTGDGLKRSFQLVKKYGTNTNAYWREIKKPVADSVQVTVADIQKLNGVDFTLDETTGEIQFAQDRQPENGEVVKAGFSFHVPVRFDADEITVNIKTFLAGDIAAIPLLEVLA